jgi:hypothetical protein
LAAQFQLVSQRLDGSLRLVISSRIGSTCVLETSTNLLNRTSSIRLTNTNGSFEFLYGRAISAQRFYRARFSL